MARKILMIDDDVMLADAVGRYLTMKGWEFHGLRLPQEAAAKAKAVKPDLVLLDIQMPGRSGWDVCKELKQDAALKHLPIIMLSGQRMSAQDKARGLELGADDYLAKPFDLQVLILKADAILRVQES